jgi:predicted phage terminase large subunit-like protein
MLDLLDAVTRNEKKIDRWLPSQAKTPKQGLTFSDFLSTYAPHIQHYDHIKALIRVLQKVADGEIKRLMVFMPPRHGKSELISRWFPAYLLTKYPERWVAVAAYAASLAYTLSRNARDNYRQAGGVLKDDAAGVEQWETGRGGGFIGAGYAGSFTGKGFHYGIIDDPIKNAEEAASATIREKHKDWWRSTWYTRQEPDAALVLVQTRWNEDDLAGWLLTEETGETPEAWHIVSMAAIKEGLPDVPGGCVLEPDARPEGSALCPERYDIGKLEKIRDRIGSYYWNAMYRQTPKPREGGLFKRAWFEENVVDSLPEGCLFVRYWDAAATAGGGDYTAGGLVAKHTEVRKATGRGDADEVINTYYICDMKRGQWSPGESDKVMRATAAADRERYGDVQIVGEQEPGASGVKAAMAFMRLLDGYRVRVETASGSKEVRAMPFASQCEAGSVKMLRGIWNAAFVNEMCDFPHGRNDDQVDVVSGAYNRLVNTARVAAY